jgi:hypothetical protein
LSSSSRSAGPTPISWSAAGRRYCMRGDPDQAGRQADTVRERRSLANMSMSLAKQNDAVGR